MGIVVTSANINTGPGQGPVCDIFRVTDSDGGKVGGAVGAWAGAGVGAVWLLCTLAYAAAAPLCVLSVAAWMGAAASVEGA